MMQAALNLPKANRYTPYIYRDGMWKHVDHWNTYIVAGRIIAMKQQKSAV